MTLISDPKIDLLLPICLQMVASRLALLDAVASRLALLDAVASRLPLLPHAFLVLERLRGELIVLVPVSLLDLHWHHLGEPTAPCGVKKVEFVVLVGQRIRLEVPL